MTVTFFPEIRDGDTKGYEIRCDEVGVVETLPADAPYPQARKRAEAHGEVCDRCAGYGAEIHEITEVPSLNVSNSNAGFILDLLGLDPVGLVGACEPNDFLVRVRTTQRLWKQEVAPWRRDDYGVRQLAQLAKISQWCIDAGRPVCWA